MTGQNKSERLQNNARFIESEIKEFVRVSPLNRIPSDAEQCIFDEPLIKYADGDDSLFTQYKEIIGPVHLTPQEAIALALNKKPGDFSEKLFVISWILPVNLTIRKSNRKEKVQPSNLWSYTRWYGEKFNEALRAHVVEVLTERGYIATAPSVGPHFKQYNNEKGPYSNWSERHIAYVAGQGTFSLSDGFITEKGIAHRCGSVVTNLALPLNKHSAGSPFSNCTFYVNGGCKACIARCPAGAITETGHNKIKCLEFQRKEFASLREALKVGNTGCGLCQTKVPCESRNPMKKARK
jgi:epoxyqueuosine reductase